MRKLLITALIVAPLIAAAKNNIYTYASVGLSPYSLNDYSESYTIPCSLLPPSPQQNINYSRVAQGGSGFRPLTIGVGYIFSYQPISSEHVQIEYSQSPRIKYAVNIKNSVTGETDNYYNYSYTQQNILAGIDIFKFYPLVFKIDTGIGFTQQKFTSVITGQYTILRPGFALDITKNISVAMQYTFIPTSVPAISSDTAIYNMSQFQISVYYYF